MRYGYKTPIDREDLKELYKANYLMARYSFIVNQAKDNPNISKNQLLKWKNLYYNYRVMAYGIRDDLFIKYNIPTDLISEYKFNLEDNCMDFNFKEKTQDD